MPINNNFAKLIAPSLYESYYGFLTKLETIPHHQEICHVCNGKGIADKQPCRYKGYLYNFTCYTCMGTGTILVWDE